MIVLTSCSDFASLECMPFFCLLPALIWNRLMIVQIYIEQLQGVNDNINAAVAQRFQLALSQAKDADSTLSMAGSGTALPPLVSSPTKSCAGKRILNVSDLVFPSARSAVLNQRMSRIRWLHEYYVRASCKDCKCAASGATLTKVFADLDEISLLECLSCDL